VRAGQGNILVGSRTAATTTAAAAASSFSPETAEIGRHLFVVVAATVVAAVVRSRALRLRTSVVDEARSVSDAVLLETATGGVLSCQDGGCLRLRDGRQRSGSSSR
jgi:hypothetical protein